jgi:hypothetical protein
MLNSSLITLTLFAVATAGATIPVNMVLQLVLAYFYVRSLESANSIARHASSRAIPLPLIVPVTGKI